MCEKRVITVIGNERGIFVEDKKMKEIQKVIMTFNKIQLRFTGEPMGIRLEKPKYIIFDDRSDSNMTIKEMFKKLEPFDKKK